MKESTNHTYEEKKETNNTNYEAIIKTFLTDTEDINSKNECGWTPLYRTIVAENDEATEVLLNIGADPNIKCNMGETALLQAVEMDRLKQVEILLNNGADPNIPQNDGRIPLHSAIVKQNLQIVELLLSFGSNPNTQGKLYGQTPLHLAVKHSVKPTILLLLVKNGGSLIIKDKYDKKPTDYVETDEMRDTINMLKLQGEVPQTPQKDILMTPSKFSKKDFLMIAKTLSDQKARKDFENYLTNNNDIHPYNIKINDLKLDDFLYRENSKEINNNNYVDDYRDKESVVSNNNQKNDFQRNQSQGSVYVANTSGFNYNGDERETIRGRFISRDANSENNSTKENFFDVTRQRSFNSINLNGVNSGNYGNDNNYYFNNNLQNNGKSTISNFNLNNTSGISNFSHSNSNNMNVQSNTHSIYPDNYLNINLNSGFFIEVKNANIINSNNANNNNSNNNSLFPFPNLNNNTNSFLNTNSNNLTAIEIIPINISSDLNSYNKRNSSSNNESNENTSKITSNIGLSNAPIPKPEKNTAVNSPNFVKNNSHFERLNSSHNSGRNSKSENEVNKNDSFNYIFNNNEEFLQNITPIIQSESENSNINIEKPKAVPKEHEYDLNRKNSSKSNISEPNNNDYNHNTSSDLNNSNHSSSNENYSNNYNYKTFASKNSNNNNFYRNCYLPTIESKGSEFESEYDRDVKSQRNSNLNKFEERLNSNENLTNREFQHLDKEGEELSNVIHFSHEIFRNNNVKDLEAVDKCYSQEINRTKKFDGSFNMKKHYSDKNKIQNTEHTNAIPEIEDDHDQENSVRICLNESKSINNERLNEDDLRLDHENAIKEIEDKIYRDEDKENSRNLSINDNSNSQQNILYVKLNDDLIKNSKSNSTSEKERISDSNPLDIINSFPQSKKENFQFDTNSYSQNNKENFNISNFKGEFYQKKNLNILNEHENNVENNQINQKYLKITDSIDADEETIGQMNSDQGNDFSKQIKSTNQKLVSKEFYDELNFYGSPYNSSKKKSYVVSELNLTSNRKSKESMRKMDISSKLKIEKEVNNNSQSTGNNFTNKKITNTEVENSSPNLEFSDKNQIKIPIKSLKKKVNESNDGLSKGKINNSMVNMNNSRSTNNVSGSQTTQSVNYNLNSNNIFKKIPISKNFNNSNSPNASHLNITDNNFKIKSLDDREDEKNFSNSFMDPSLNLDYTSTKIDFNYNTNSKNSPRYLNHPNHSAFIIVDENSLNNSNSNNIRNTIKSNTSKNKKLNSTNKSNINKSNLSPNSQKKINYFNTDICDISITKKPLHHVEKTSFNFNKENQNQENKKAKFKLHSNLIDNDNEIDDRYMVKTANNSTRNNTSDINIFRNESTNRNYKANKKLLNLSNQNENLNKTEINYRSKVDFPNTISCFEDYTPKNNSNTTANNVNSEYFCDETNITNYHHNITTMNQNFEYEEMKNCSVNNQMNNTVGNIYMKNHINKNSKDNRYFMKIKTNNQSYVSEKNNYLDNKNGFNLSSKVLKSNICENFSPHSMSGMNINLKGLKSPTSLIGNRQNPLMNKSNMNKNIYVETLYYGSEINNSNSQINSISKNDAKKLHNWLISMNLQNYYNNFIEKGLVDIDRIIALANDQENKLKFQDFENMGIKKPGHIYKILTRIDFDAKLIDQNLAFLVQSGNMMRNSMSNSQMNVRVSSSNFLCCGSTRENNKPNEGEKAQNLDLIAWLKYVNLPHLRKNFLHNGFDSIEYLILQCFSIYLVDENLLENHLHIYNKADRKKILSQLAKDLNIINKKICNQSINLNNFDLLSEYGQTDKIEAGCTTGCTIF